MRKNYYILSANGKTSTGDIKKETKNLVNKTYTVIDNDDPKLLEKKLWIQHGGKGKQGRINHNAVNGVDVVICCHPELYRKTHWFDKHIMKECKGILCGYVGGYQMKVVGFKKKRDNTLR